jgi:N-methylhydantoinase A/oxoprolinase/acetone carboxylase beta subunit
VPGADAGAGRRVASDTGGTFTDLVLDDGTLAKVPSTPEDPSRAVRAGLAALLGDGAAAVLAHGTTVATNALLERRGARVALVTNAAFADVIEIARQDRPSLYDQTVDRPVPLVPRRWRYEVRGRLAADGTEIEPLDPSTLPPLDPAIEAVAVCLLHSDRNPAHERAVGAELRRRGVADVTLSCELSPEFREYERTVTTVVNAYVRPVCRAYLGALAATAGTVLVMTSAGGLVPAAEGADQPGRLLLSGPAGGALAGAALAAANGWPDALTFDMGGTSTDVCLVQGGRPEPAAERAVAGFPVRLPSLDVHTIGAGGGSIARIDEGGALVVGPESAGAVPGPACYGHGGRAATVTDANLVAGRLPAGVALPGLGVLDAAAAAAALVRAGVAAEDVLAVVDAAMEQALRRVSVERGVDPRGLALVAFGGAGPLHACALADALGLPAVIVPPRAGVFSAVGILGAPRQVDVVRSWPTPLDHTGLDDARRALEGEARAQLGTEGPAATVVGALDCRYAGQSHELRVPGVADFGAEHERRNGYARPETPVEVIALRATALRPSPVALADLPVPARSPATGPAVVAEPDCTIWIPEGWRADVGEAGALVLRRR